MAKYDYRVIQLKTSIRDVDARKGMLTSKAVNDLTQILNQNADDGYELFSQIAVGVDIQPGCLGSLTGQGIQTKTVYLTVFRKELESQSD